MTVKMALQRVETAELPGWRARAESLGFVFHEMYGAPYWQSRAHYVCDYAATEREIEDATTELHEMCVAFAERAVTDDAILSSLRIPPEWWDCIADSWRRGDRDLYGRFDLSWDGQGAAKLLEYNADTPTALYETGFYQWDWLEQAKQAGQVPIEADQFNSVHDKLVAAWPKLFPDDLSWPGLSLLHLACLRGSEEDFGTVQYLMDCAVQAGVPSKLGYLEDIGLRADGAFADENDVRINVLFKLYPWEQMIRDEFAQDLQQALLRQQIRVIEPVWKMVLSNKGILPWLWRLFPGHPNLLPAWFADDPAANPGNSYVIKPLLSREGANVTLMQAGRRDSLGGPYGAEGAVIQHAAPLPIFADRAGHDHHLVVGSWVVAGQACGMGLREDDSPITQDTSRFVPHILMA